jgi:hypothetical protein
MLEPGRHLAGRDRGALRLAEIPQKAAAPHGQNPAVAGERGAVRLGVVRLFSGAPRAMIE